MPCCAWQGRSACLKACNAHHPDEKDTNILHKSLSNCNAEATTVTVHDGSGSELQPVAAYHPSLSGSAQMPPGLVPVASGGKRRVLAAAPGLPAPSSPQISQTSVSALSRKSRECRGLSWGLDLYAGQNDFIITTMKSGQVTIPCS